MIRLLILGIALFLAENGRAQATTVVSATRAGAGGNGKHDDTAALRKLFTHLPNRPDVTIDLGSGTYLVSGSQLSSICGYYVLGLGVTTKLPPALHLKGKGARIVTNQKTNAQLLAIVAKLSSLSIEGVTFERKEVATASDVNFTGGPGVYLTDSKAKLAVNMVSFSDCRFINCHRGITVISRFMDLNNDPRYPYYETAGLLRKLDVNRCEFLYPYGSNSTATNGGSQALFIGNWVGRASVTDCKFDGAVGGSVAKVPNHLPKDGFIFGEPRHLIAKGNHLANFAVEGIFAYQQIGFTLVEKPFPVPPIRNGHKNRATTIQTGGRCEQLTRGQRLWYPGAGYLIVSRIRSDTAVDVYGSGDSCNAPAGTMAPSGRFLSMPRGFPDPKTEMENNVIDGGIVTGSPDLQIGRPGIRVDEMQVTITRNKITALTGIMLNGSAATFPALVTQTGSTISGNTFNLPDTTVLYEGKPMPITRGLENYQPGVTVENNTVLLAANKNANALLVSAPNVQVLNNQISAQTAATKGLPSVGVFIGANKMAAGQAPKVEGNSFKMLDIGIGTTPGQFNSVFVGPGNSYSQVVVPIQTTGLKVSGPAESKPQ